MGKISDRFKYLNLQWRVRGTFAVRVIERPGLWMPQAQIDELLDSLRDLTQRAIGGDLNYGILSGDPERLRNAIVTLIVDRKSGQIMAFNALTYMPVVLRGKAQQAVHLGLVIVDPELRTKGLSWVLYGLTCILIFFRRGLRPLWVSNVTQVPAIIGKVAEAFVTAYPNPFNPARRTFDHLSVARQIMEKHCHVFGVSEDAGFDEIRFVITDAYRGGSDNLKKTFDDAPKHRDPRPNDLCEQELDYERGDDFLQIARFDLGSARNYLLREVPRQSIVALGWQLLFAILSFILVPVIHWLNPNADSGTLRARKK